MYSAALCHVLPKVDERSSQIFFLISGFSAKESGERFLSNRNSSNHCLWLKPSHTLNETMLLLQLPVKEWVEYIQQQPVQLNMDFVLTSS